MRILACISASVQSQAVIRHAARIALEQGAELLALHIESHGAGTRRAPHISEQLERNLRLARDLGAHVTVQHHHRVVESILSFARDHDVRRIVVGAPRRDGWRRHFTRDIVSLLRRDNSMTIDVVSES